LESSEPLEIPEAEQKLLQEIFNLQLEREEIDNETVTVSGSEKENGSSPRKRKVHGKRIGLLEKGLEEKMLKKQPFESPRKARLQRGPALRPQPSKGSPSPLKLNPESSQIRVASQAAASSRRVFSLRSPEDKS
jgi:hypothetical protein